MGVDARMFFKVRYPVSKRQVADWAYMLYGAFGDHVTVWHGDQARFFDWPPHHCMEFIDKYEQDGPTIEPEEGETFIEVHLAGRFYDKGYERGPFYVFKAIAEWLEDVIPGAEVWYGGDSSGCVAFRFDRGARERLFKYFCDVGHLPYLGVFNRGAKMQVCTLCAKPLIHTGGGVERSFYYCYGCREKVITKNGEVVVKWHDHVDFFAKIKELEESGQA